MTPAAPLCTNCRHHAADHHCKRSAPMVNTVTGEPFYPSCESERAKSIRSVFVGLLGRCGPQGRFFELGAPPKGGSGVQFRWETPSGGED